MKPKNSDYSLHPVNLHTTTGRGIAVYSHESLSKSVSQIEPLLNFEETCLLEIRLRGGDLLLLASCYRSPIPSESSNQNNEKLNRLFRCIEKKKNYSHRCIVGDFSFKNINWSPWATHCNENSTETSFIEAVHDSYLYQHVEETTRRRGNDDPSLLDLILTNEAMQVSDIQHHSPLGKSDHSVVSFKVHCYLDFTKAKESYAYAKGDYVSMRNELENSNWLRTYTTLNE